MAASARELRYPGSRYIAGDLAYELDLDDREHQLRHAGDPRLERQAAAQPRVRSVSHVQVRERQRVSPVSVLGFLAAAALAVLILLNYATLTELSTSVVKLKSQMAELETQNVTLTAQYEKIYDLSTVRAAAEAAGMTKPSGSQIGYIDLSDGDSATVYETEKPGLVSRALTSLSHGVYTVVEYFD